MKSHYRGWLCLVAVPKAIVLRTVFKGSVCNLNSKKTLLDLPCLGFIFKLCQNPQCRIFYWANGLFFPFSSLVLNFQKSARLQLSCWNSKWYYLRWDNFYCKRHFSLSLSFSNFSKYSSFGFHWWNYILFILKYYWLEFFILFCFFNHTLEPKGKNTKRIS